MRYILYIHTEQETHNNTLMIFDCLVFQRHPMSSSIYFMILHVSEADFAEISGKYMTFHSEELKVDDDDGLFCFFLCIRPPSKAKVISDNFRWL